jgi:hypothetical protein
LASKTLLAYYTYTLLTPQSSRVCNLELAQTSYPS